MPAVPKRAVRALLSHDAGEAERAVRWFGKNASVMMYAASKIAVSRWVRRSGNPTVGRCRDTAERSRAGCGPDADAAGAVVDPKEAQNVRSFPIPIGGFGDAGQLADWVCFMLSDAEDFLCGSVVFVDGGSDAYFRADDWPRAVPAYRLISFLKRFRAR